MIYDPCEQVKCFNAPLQPAEIVGVKRVVQEQLPDGVNELGLTLTGFLFLHALFIEKGRLETTWTVLRKFGYDDDIKLRGDLLAVPSKKAPDQVSISLQFNGLPIFQHCCKTLLRLTLTCCHLHLVKSVQESGNFL